MKKTLLALTALSLAVPVATAPLAAADMGQHVQRAGQISLEQSNDFRRKHYNRGYRNYNDQQVGANTRIWRDKRDGRYYCKKDNGTTGLLIGAGVGGLAGHEIAGRGDKTLGVILGAAGGALLGREIDRSNYRCR